MDHAILFVVYLDKFSKATGVVIVYSFCVAKCLEPGENMTIKCTVYEQLY